MLYLFFITNFLIIISALIGVGILNWSEQDQPLFDRWSDRLIISIWLGIVALALSLFTLAFLVPLSPLVGISTALILIIICNLSACNRKEIIYWQSQLNSKKIIIFSTLTILVVAIMSKAVIAVDTGLYHFGAIKWLREYGIVPGIGLINSRFGFISTWFAFSSPMNSEIFSTRVSATANCLVVTVALWQLFIAGKYILQGEARMPDWFIGIVLTLTLPVLVFSKYMKDILISTSPDIPVILLAQIISWLILSLALQANYHQSLNPCLIPLILGIGIFSIKLSGLPLLVISYLFYVFGHGFTRQKLLIGTSICLILLTPVIVAGILITGCPLYPSQFMCLDTPWSISLEDIVRERKKILFLKSYRFIGEWFNASITNKMMTSIVVISLIAMIFIAKYIWQTKITKTPEGRAFFWIIGLGLTGLIFVLVQSPIIRFTLPYLWIIPGGIIALICDQYSITSKISSQVLTNLYSSKQKLLSASLIVSVITVIFVSNNPDRGLIFPPPFPKQPNLSLSKVNDIDFVYAVRVENTEFQFPLCWDAKLPCSTGKLEDIQLIAPAQGIAGGFINVR